MRRVVGVLALVLLAVGLGGSSARSVAVAQAPPKASAVLAIVDVYNSSRLVWLDPATLRPLRRASVALPGGAWSPVFSPAGRYIAFGGLGSIGIRIVDLRHMRVTVRVAALRYSNRRLVPLAWPERRRLLVLDSPQDARGSPEALVAIDPVAGKVVARTVRASTAKAWTNWVSTGRQLVALSQSTEEMGSARLVVFGPGGGILKATDVGIVAGVWLEGPPGSRIADPGLAVDPGRRRAFVVDPQTLAQVDLDTLDVSYTRLTESRSLLSRLLGWLEPAAQAKLASGFSRQATWLGNEMLAVSGATFGGARSTPAGLYVVDAKTGATRMLEPRASAQRFSQGLVLAFGASRDGATNIESGMGLAAYSREGVRLWNALGDEPVWLVETAAGYAYVPTPEESFPPGLRVIDLATGAVIRTVRAEMPTFVVRD